MKLLIFIIILLLISPFSIGYSNIIRYNEDIRPLGSPGPIVAKLLEYYASITDQYYIQNSWIRDYYVYSILYGCYSSNENVLIVDDEGDGNYSSIQDSIDHSQPGDVILVYSGKYNESIKIDKSIFLFGINHEYENGDDFGKPIINFSKDYNSLCSVLINSDNVTFSGFKIISDVTGILVLNSSNQINLCYNTLRIKQNSSALRIKCNNSQIMHNIFNAAQSKKTGIIIENTNNSNFYNNIVENFSIGFNISNSQNNYFEKNNIKNNNFYGILFNNGIIKNNIFSLNNFLFNNKNVLTNNSIEFLNNSWHLGELGNYWHDYSSNDYNNDGIGDEPYITSNGLIIDYYPIINIFQNTLPDKPMINPDERGVLCLKTNNNIPIYIYFNDIDSDNVSYIFFLGNKIFRNNDLIKVGRVVEFSNVWNSSVEGLVTIYNIQVLVYDRHFFYNLSNPYEVHIYDLSKINNIRIRTLLDNLIPSYFLTDWN
jgi:hypothetical protein